MANPPKTPLFVRQIPGGFFSLVSEDLYPGKVIWVNATTGSNTNNGGPDDPLATVAAAILLCEDDGDTILVRGNISEAVTVTSGCTGLRIIGVGTGPTQTTWTSATTDATCITVNATDCLIRNIKFRPPVYASGTPAAIKLSGAHQTRIEKCRFQGRAGSFYGIHSDGNNANCVIMDNDFWYLNNVTTISGTAIGGSGYTVGENSGWIVCNNRFHSNSNHIVCRMRQSFIIENYFASTGLLANNTTGTATVLTLDLGSATTGGCNVVTRNHFGCLYHVACLVSAPNDSWSGNFCTDRSHPTQVDATTGISILVPA